MAATRKLHCTPIIFNQQSKTSDKTTSLSWQQWAAGNTGTVILGQRLELSAGWAYHDVDARHRATGLVNETKNLASGSQGRFAIAWQVRSGGRVGLVLQQGSYQQVKFRFSRQFR